MVARSLLGVLAVTDPAKLIELAERVEALTGPCRETDAEVAILSGWATSWDGVPYRKHPYLPGVFIDDTAAGCLRDCPGFTAALDAAMTLLPEKHGPVDLTFQGSGQAFIHGLGPCDDYMGTCEYAATPALALTAACLRAMAGRV
jgi:hypothetical protein